MEDRSQAVAHFSPRRVQLVASPCCAHDWSGRIEELNRCSGRGSNPHGILSQGILSPSRLPVSPPEPDRRARRNEAGNGTRTRDPNLGKVVLYQLSYSRDIRHLTAASPSPGGSDSAENTDLGGDGGEGNRTPDLLNAIQALSQLSYAPGHQEPKIVPRGRAKVKKRCSGESATGQYFAAPFSQMNPCETHAPRDNRETRVSVKSNELSTRRLRHTRPFADRSRNSKK